MPLWLIEVLLDIRESLDDVVDEWQTSMYARELRLDYLLSKI